MGTITFYRLNMMISGACTALVCLIMFALMLYHATHLSKPREQIKYDRLPTSKDTALTQPRIMKICMLLPLYTITSFISICFPKADVYLEPWLEVFQAVALGAFFLLLCDFIASDNQTEVDVFFAAFEAPQKKNGDRVHGLAWFRVCMRCTPRESDNLGRLELANADEGSL